MVQRNHGKYAYAVQAASWRSPVSYCVKSEADAKRHVRSAGSTFVSKSWAKGSSCADAKKKAVAKVRKARKGTCKKSYSTRSMPGIPKGHWAIVERTKGSRKTRVVATRPKGKAAVDYATRRNAAACRRR